MKFFILNLKPVKSHCINYNFEQGYIDRRIVRKRVNIMPSYHNVQNQGKLIMQSRQNGQKTHFGHLFDDFEVKYLQISNFSEK